MVDEHDRAAHDDVDPTRLEPRVVGALGGALGREGAEHVFRRRLR